MKFNLRAGARAREQSSPSEETPTQPARAAMACAALMAPLVLAAASRAMPRLLVSRSRLLATRMQQFSAVSPGEGLVLIDGHGLAYRMSFALADTGMTTASNEATHALHGFLLKLLALNKMFPGHSMAVAFDLPGRTFRDDLLPEYKQTRPPMPVPLRTQMAAIQTAVELMGVPSLTAEGFEADDVIASCVAAATRAGMSTVKLVTADKDLMQLVSGEGAATEVMLWNDRQKKMYDATAVEAILQAEPSRGLRWRRRRGRR